MATSDKDNGLPTMAKGVVVLLAPVVTQQMPAAVRSFIFREITSPLANSVYNEKNRGGDFGGF